MSKKADDFKKELRALLEKYDASIVFNVSDRSNTHALYMERLEVEFHEMRPYERFKRVTETEELVKGWAMFYNDLQVGCDEETK